MGIVRWIAAVGAFSLAAAHAMAQYPSKPIRILVPFAAGGGGDIVTRALALPLSQALGQPVVVEPKPGADGQIAAIETMRSPNDGHTLLFGSTTSMSSVPAVRKTPPYDPNIDFTPISSFCTVTFFLFVHPSVPARSLRELVDYARLHPGKLSYGSGNATSIMAAAELQAHARINMVHIPYKGEAPAALDFSAGRIQVMFATPASMMPLVKDGKLRALVTTLGQRSPLLPDVPTIGEAGYPEPSALGWVGFFGPANMPPAVTERLSREINAILQRDEMREQLAKYGFAARGSSPEELAFLVKQQLEIWRSAVRAGTIVQEQ